MAVNLPSRVTTLIDIGLSPDEHYIQFVPPATFGVIFDRAMEKVYLVRADGERSILRRAADKIYTLRGFIGMRRREEGDLELGWPSIEDEIIRLVIASFGSYEKLCSAVWKYCPLRENAEIIRDIWAATVFIKDIQEDEEEDTASTNATSDMVSDIHSHTPRLDRYDSPFSEFEHTAPVIDPVYTLSFMDMSSPTLHPHPLYDHKVDNDSFQYTSLQEMEQFTLPIAYQPSFAYAPVPFLSATASGNQASEDMQFGGARKPSPAKDKPVATVCIPRMEDLHSMGHTRIFYEPPQPRLLNMATEPFNNWTTTAYHPPSQPPPFAVHDNRSFAPTFDSRKRVHTPESSDLQGPSSSMGDERAAVYESTPLFKPLAVANSAAPLSSQSLHSQTPAAFLITPLQPIMQQAPSEKSRPEQEASGTTSDFDSTFLTNRPQENEIYAEIQASISQEVMRNRNGSSERKMELVNSLVSQFRLPRNYDIVEQCYRAVCGGLETCARRIKDFFLKEGMEYRKSYPLEDYSYIMSEETLSNHACETCDGCLWRFFTLVQLSSVIDVSAVLRDVQLREGMVKFYRYAMQLGIRAAWAPDFRESGYNNYFDSLDRFTANLNFPRRGDIAAGPVEDRIGMKRRKTTA